MNSYTEKAWAYSADGKLVSVTSVPNGLACNCFCPGCNQPLVASHPKEDIKPYFRHNNPSSNDSNCSNPNSRRETIIHELAKAIIMTLPSAYLPAYNSGKGEWRYRKYPDTELCPSKSWIFSDTKEEDRSLNGTKRIPDIITDTDRGRLIIEVKVTHAVEDEKASELNKLGVYVIEVDFSTVDIETFGHKTVTDRLGSGTYSKWLCFQESESEIELLNQHVKNSKFGIDAKISQEEYQAKRDEERDRYLAEDIERERIESRMPAVKKNLESAVHNYITSYLKVNKIVPFGHKDRVNFVNLSKKISLLAEKMIPKDVRQPLHMGRGNGTALKQIIFDEMTARKNEYHKYLVQKLKTSFIELRCGKHEAVLAEFNWDLTLTDFSKSGDLASEYFELTIYPELDGFIKETSDFLTKTLL